MAILRLAAIAACLAATTHAQSSAVPAPQCWGGTAGDNSGPTCGESALYAQHEVESPSCSVATASSICMENNEQGMGDGCPHEDDGSTTPRDQASCESYRPQDRSADESFDGTTRHCRWVPAKTAQQKTTACAAISGCTFHADRGMQVNGVPQGSCATSDAMQAELAVWSAKQGTECRNRVRSGCFENNAWMGESDTCTSVSDATACAAVTDGCSGQGTCAGTLHAGVTDSRVCGDRHSENDCTQAGAPPGNTTGCTWTPQCCQWVAAPADPAAACRVGGGPGSLDGLCEYSDGTGAPSKSTVQAGFEHGLFRQGPEFTGKCGMVATFVKGKGAAVTLNSDKAAAVCEIKDAWESVAEHVGHTPASIKDYCANFVPEPSAMAALQQHSPGAIIEFAKQGRLGTVMPGLKDQLFIVTAKPEYGECLFTSAVGVYGAAICTCDSHGCNNQTALEFLVDMDVGPMRLLQFIDGSMAGLKDGINAVVPGAVDANGMVNPESAATITEAHVEAIMQVPGVSDKTSKAELWGLIQDFTRARASAAAYTASGSSNGNGNGATEAGTTTAAFGPGLPSGNTTTPGAGGDQVTTAQPGLMTKVAEAPPGTTVNKGSVATTTTTAQLELSTSMADPGASAGHRLIPAAAATFVAALAAACM